MMRYFKPYYIVAVLIGGWIIWYNIQGNKKAEEFYGFAENRDTEINFNYPVVVKRIHITEGQKVKKGDPLFHLQRVQPREELAEESYRIAELRAEAEVWRSKKIGDLKIKKAEYQLALQDLEDKKDELSRELNYKKKLYGRIQSLEETTLDYSSIEKEIEDLQKKKNMLDSIYLQEKENIEEELKIGKNPYIAEIQRMEAKMNFDESQLVQDIEIHAPFEGLVGNIQCKEEEHIPSYKVLMNLYEPNPSLVKGYIHEDLILKVKVDDQLMIMSSNNPEIFFRGIVTGLGSRVIEIPSRLRKIPELKTYGREVLISIPSDNTLIQKEKVVIEVL